ncbi:hypothetical protein Q8A67_005677 [Cirrhinus molitorella]|uniref:Uncharacterized protein n=1 Tax=Cirrhinus molitorella TaxID=172907 RepID=A0AA88Q3S5_9TELE|nr:hypothetical protein Q8A67_005677 [Cirrhinus molitorella]
MGRRLLIQHYKSTTGETESQVEYQENNTYSCVINNPISNQTQHLDISKLCHTSSGQGLPLSYIVLISASGCLLIVAAVMMCICRKHRKTDLGRRLLIQHCKSTTGETKTKLDV